jgi:hypothetical protein
VGEVPSGVILPPKTIPSSLFWAAALRLTMTTRLNKMRDFLIARVFNSLYGHED